MFRSAAKKRDPRRARAVGAAELVGGDVCGRRVQALGSSEQPPEVRAHPGRPDRVRNRRELRPHEPDQGDELAPLAECQRRREQAHGEHTPRLRECDLQGDPAAHRIPHHVGAVDSQRVHVADHGLGEEPGVVGSPCGLGRSSEPGEVDRVDGVLRRQRRDGLEERGLVRAETVQADDVLRAFAGDEAADRRPRNPDVGDPQKRRAVARQPEESLETQSEVEVPASVQPALGKRIESRQAALAQPDPGCGVASDHDVGIARGRRPDDAALAARSHLPGPAHVAEAHLVGGIEVRIVALVAGWESAEGLLHAANALPVKRDARRPTGVPRRPPPSRSLTHRRAGRYLAERPSTAARTIEVRK